MVPILASTCAGHVHVSVFAEKSIDIIMNRHSTGEDMPTPLCIQGEASLKGQVLWGVKASSESAELFSTTRQKNVSGPVSDDQHGTRTCPLSLALQYSQLLE